MSKRTILDTGGDGGEGRACAEQPSADRLPNIPDAAGPTAAERGHG